MKVFRGLPIQPPRAFRSIAVTAFLILLSGALLPISTASAAQGASGLELLWSTPVSQLPVQLPEQISPVEAGESYLSLSPDGTHAGAIWLSDGSYPIRFASASIQGNSAVWSSASSYVTVSRPDCQSGCSNAQVRISSDGTLASASWLNHASDGNDQVTFASAVISNGTATWGTAQSISTPGERAADPILEMSADGTVVSVAWYSVTGGHYLVKVRSGLVNGLTSNWSDGIRMLSNPTGTERGFALAMSLDGSKVISAWNQDGFDTSSGDVGFASAAIVSGIATWSAAQNIATGFSAQHIQLAFSNDGSRAAALWQHGDNGAVELAALSIVPGGVSAALSLEYVPGGQAPSWDPALALSSNGQRVAVGWGFWDGDLQHFRIKSYVGDVGALSASSPQIVSSEDFDSSVVSIGISSDGSRAIAAWLTGTVNGTAIDSIGATVSQSSAAWDASPTTIVSSADSLMSPQVVLSPSGYLATGIWRRGSSVESSSALVNPAATPPSPAPTPSTSQSSGASAPTSTSLAVLPSVPALPQPITIPALRSQTPLKSCAAKIKRMADRRLVRVLRGGCLTNAGQKVSVTVTARRDGRTRPLVKAIQTTASGSRLVATQGSRGRLRVHWFAPATSDFSAYSAWATIRR